MDKRNLDYEEVVIRLSRMKRLGIFIGNFILRLISLGTLGKEAVDELPKMHKDK